MKLNKYIFAFVAGASVVFGLTGCQSDDDFLTEHSYKYDDNGFYNSQDEIEEAINPCYREVQYLVQGQTHGGHSWMLMGWGDDTFGEGGWNDHFSNWNTLTSQSGYTRHWYNELYYLVNYANTAIDEIDEKTAVKYTSTTKKAELRAEAVFFQAWAYRCLAGMYGQVPILEHHSTEITLGYKATTRDSVWQFCYTQFKYAAENLPIKPRKAGCITRAAADHMLAEICLDLGKFQEAKDACDRVINGTDGDYKLMTTRFGNRKSEKVDRYGHSLAAPAGAYWDLFREGTGNNDANQDCAENKEAIWVSQYAYNNYAQGGGGDSWWRIRANTVEANWQCGSTRYNTTNKTNKGGKKFYLWGDDAACYPVGVKGNSTTKALAGTTAATAGRYVANDQRDSIGGGYAYAGTVCYPTRYVQYQLWAGTGNDIRGSETMMQRNWYNPGGMSRYQAIAEAKARMAANPDDAAYTINASDTTALFARFWKFTDDHHPGGATVGGAWNNLGDNKSYDCEWYMIRIAETYLLKAEAQLALNDKAGAAETINVLRARAGANLVSASDINIDFILDERTRELFGEEHRVITLNRLSCNPHATYISDCHPTQDATTANTFYDRVRAYGFSYDNVPEATNIGIGRVYDKVNLRWIPNVHPWNYQYPIPVQVIQSNTGIEYPQNPGY
jgi:hypothetical protein